jgi:hypothetical protein
VVSHKYFNNILFPNYYKISTSSKKCFFAQGTCHSLDHGYHHARSSKSKGETKTTIVYFEFHYKPYTCQRQLNKQKLIGLVPDFSRKALQLYAKKQGHSFHAAIELLQSKYEYIKDFQCSTDLVAEPVLLATFDALGIEYANLFEYRSSIHRAFEKKTLLLRHKLSHRLDFLTDWWHLLYLRVAGGLKGAFRRIAASLRG